MKKTFYLVFLTLLIIRASAQNVNKVNNQISQILSLNDKNVQNVLDAAKRDMYKYLETIPQGREADYGFNSRHEFELVSLGKPYHIITINNEFFNKNKNQIKKYFAETREWRVPLIVNGNSRILLTVANNKGSWEAVGIGASKLAKELDDFAKIHSGFKKYETILRVYQITSEFIIHSEGTSINAYPLNSAKAGLGGKENRYPLPNLLSLIKNNVSNK